MSISLPLPTVGVAASTNAPLDLPETVVGAYFDPASSCYFVFAEPSAAPGLWDSYLGGARRSYRQHGVESAIEYAQVRDGRCTALFVGVLDGAGRVVGGLRVQGRLTASEQAHAVGEWAGRPGTAELHAQIADRLPFGVIEIKAVWVDYDDDRSALIAALARTFIHAMDVANVRYALCTAAEHAAPRWQTSGGVIASEVAAVAYPDERYRTRLMWWDRRRIADLISADQYAALTRESDLLFRRPATVPTLPSVA